MIFGNSDFKFWKMNVEYPSVDRLIPQRKPFVMIDRLEHFDMVVTQTTFEVREDNIFVENGLFSASGLLENMAQTCAARMGYINSMSNEGVKVGVIGTMRGFKILGLPPVGMKLTTTLEVQEEMFNIVLGTTTVRDERQNILATGQMKIALTDIDAK